MIPPILSCSSDLQTIFVIPDFYCSIFYLQNIFENVAKSRKNTRFVLFTLPGQHLTFYDEKQVLNNADVGKIVDGFVFQMLKKGKVGEKEIIKFIGTGNNKKNTIYLFIYLLQHVSLINSLKILNLN